MTSSSIPDGFSMGELELLQKAAAEREEAEAAEAAEAEADMTEQEKIEREAFGGKTREDIRAAVEKACDDVMEVCGHPVAHKVMAMQIIVNMIEWHNKRGINFMTEDGETECGAAWLRDAGKFQACMDILTSISLGKEDWTCDN